MQAIAITRMNSHGFEQPTQKQLLLDMIECGAKSDLFVKMGIEFLKGTGEVLPINGEAATRALGEAFASSYGPLEEENMKKGIAMSKAMCYSGSLPVHIAQLHCATPTPHPNYKMQPLTGEVRQTTEGYQAKHARALIRTCRCSTGRQCSTSKRLR
jgi:hypothetical protein